jgi:hypothetical protein
MHIVGSEWAKGFKNVASGGNVCENRTKNEYGLSIYACMHGCIYVL